MAMGVSARKGMAASINVTPMIDVLLVLLIIFMVMQQGVRKGIALQVLPPKTVSRPHRRPTPSCWRCCGAAATPSTAAGWCRGAAVRRGAHLRRPGAQGALREGGREITYGEVIAALDATRAAGVTVISLVPRTI